MRRSLFNKRFLQKFVIFLIVSAFLIIFVSKRSDPYSEVVVTFNNTSEHTKNQKVILFWTPFFDDAKWLLENDSNVVKCPVGDCIFTNQRSYLPSEDMFDAIVFHSAREFPNGIPNIRNTQQVYVFASLESPSHTHHNLAKESSFYNLTMSYRLDSDVIWSYSQIVDKLTGNVIAPNRNPRWREVDSLWTENDTELSKLFLRKNGSVAWFASNCNTNSNREDLVKELQKYTSVHIYGRCGQFKCPRFHPECDSLLDHYNFYLSFENSLCADYVTEKFFNALNERTVPIVFGGANYSQFAPPFSYIDAQAFATIRHLADYLMNLSTNPRAYLKYFWWRKYYRIRSKDLNFPSCELCQYLHTKSKQPKIYENIESFWREDKCVNKAKIEF